MLRSSPSTPQLNSHRIGLHHDPIFSGDGAAGGTLSRCILPNIGRKKPAEIFKHIEE